MSATFTAMNLLGPAGFLRRPLKQTCLRPLVVIVSILTLSVFADTLCIPTTQTRQQSSLGGGGKSFVMERRAILLMTETRIGSSSHKASKRFPCCETVYLWGI